MRSLSLAAAAGVLALTLASAQQNLKQASFQIHDLAFASTSSLSQPVVTFSGQKVVRFSTSSSQQHRQLLEQAHRLGLDVWRAQVGSACGSGGEEDQGTFGCVDVRMARDGHDEDPVRVMESQEQVMQSLMHGLGEQEQLRKRVMIEDLQEVVVRQHQKAKSKGAKDWHRDYHPLEEVEAYMRLLEQSYPGYVRVDEIGKTHEGRPILALKIGTGLDAPPSPPPSPPPEEPQPDPPSNITSVANTDTKLGILITGGQHAREWISTSTSLFFASDLLRAAFGDEPTSPFKKPRKGRKSRKRTWTRSSALAMLRTFTITVIPVSNPDGYAYSWSKNRMWRKNRQPNKFPSGLFCKGVDLNRNWGYAFASSAATGAAFSGPCSEMYPGTEAFSAAETRAIASYLADPANNMHGYFDLHSYGQLMMYPYSYSCDQTVADEEDLLEVSLGAISALKRVHGRQFNTGKVCAVYAQGGGNSVDWSYASDRGVDAATEKRRVKWSFSIELRDGGTYGFLLPPKQIVPAGEELAAALKYVLDFIAKKDSH